MPTWRKHVWVLGTLVLLGSCAVESSLFGPGNGNASTAATGPGSGGGATTGGGNSSSVASTGAGVECAMTAPPTAECDPSCGACANGVCSIYCSAGSPCNGQTIVCPEGLSCDVECSDGACADATIQCPSLHQCFVQCIGDQTCVGAQINCGPNADDGACQLRCSTGIDVCTNTAMMCGQNSCIAQCLSDSAPTLSCGESCKCIPCP